MPNPRIKQILNELPFEKKLVGGGALLMGLSLFFPWYSDIDSLHTGQIFTGLSGPLYLVGFTMLLISVLSIVFVIMDYFHHRVSFFNIKSSRMYFGFGILSFYLLFVENSVYFDNNFGVNLAVKEPGYGMFMAFIASALLTAGGHMALRERKALLQEFEEETRDVHVATAKAAMPKIEQQKSRESIRTVYPNPQPTTSSSQLSDAEKQKIRENLRRIEHGTTAFVPKNGAEQHLKPRPNSQSMGSHNPDLIKIPEQKVISGEKSEKAPQPFRMDL